MARKRDLISLYKKVLKAQNECERMEQKNVIELAENISEIGKHSIAVWYASYEPIFYNRTRSFYDVFSVYKKGTKVGVLFDSSAIDSYYHRVSGEYIYENSFIRGFHGGAIDGDEHPSPGTPYWRKPFPHFTKWGSPAASSESPYSMMNREIDKYLLEFKRRKQKEFDNEIVIPLQRSVNSLFRK